MFVRRLEGVLWVTRHVGAESMYMKWVGEDKNNVSANIQVVGDDR